MTKKTLVAGLLCGLLVAGAGGLAWVLAAPGDPLLSGYEAVEEGMTEAQVAALLGEPKTYATHGPKRAIWHGQPERGMPTRVVVTYDAEEIVVSKSRMVYEYGGLSRPRPWWERLLARLY